MQSWALLLRTWIKKGVSAMRSTHALCPHKFLSSVLVIVMCAVLLTACGTRMNSTATGSHTTVSSLPTSRTVAGYGRSYGCPSDVLVSPAPDTVVPEDGKTAITAHTGDVVEIQLPFGVAWHGPTTAQGALQLQQPAGYAWKPSNACIWRFLAKGIGTAVLDFSGSAICKKASLCVPSVEEATFTLHID